MGETAMDGFAGMGVCRWSCDFQGWTSSKGMIGGFVKKV